MGGFEAPVSAEVEPTLKYHPEHVCGLTPIPMKLGGGPCMLGSLTGAVSSEKVTEERNGRLSADGNRVAECKSISRLYCETDGSSSLERGL